MNGTVDKLNKILEHALTKVCNANQDDWDLKIPTVMWAYRTTCKRLTRQTPLKLVYGKEAIMPMEYIVPSLRIVAMKCMDDEATLEENIAQLIHLEEYQWRQYWKDIREWGIQNEKWIEVSNRPQVEKILHYINAPIRGNLGTT